MIVPPPSGNGSSPLSPPAPDRSAPGPAEAPGAPSVDG